MSANNGLLYFLLHENSFWNALFFSHYIKIHSDFLKNYIKMLFWKWILRNLTIVFCNFFKTRTHVIIAQIFSCLLFIPRVRPYQLAPVSTADQSVLQLNYLSLWFQISISICVKIIAINHKPDQITQMMINKVIGPPYIEDEYL